MIPSTTNNYSDVRTVSGSYTGTDIVDYLVEIDGEGSTNTFRWSKDGGITFVGEKLEVSTTAYDLGDGLQVSFTQTSNHLLGNSWTFLAEPTRVVVGLKSLPTGISGTVGARLARDALDAAIRSQSAQGLLSISSSSEATDDQLTLYHSMDQILTLSLIHI